VCERESSLSAFLCPSLSLTLTHTHEQQEGGKEGENSFEWKEGAREEERENRGMGREGEREGREGGGQREKEENRDSSKVREKVVVVCVYTCVRLVEKGAYVYVYA